MSKFRGWRREEGVQHSPLITGLDGQVDRGIPFSGEGIGEGERLGLVYVEVEIHCPGKSWAFAFGALRRNFLLWISRAEVTRGVEWGRNAVRESSWVEGESLGGTTSHSLLHGGKLPTGRKAQPFLGGCQHVLLQELVMLAREGLQWERSPQTGEPHGQKENGSP